MEMKLLGNIYGENFGTGYAGNVWDKNGICPTLMNMQGGQTTNDSRNCPYQTSYGKGIHRMRGRWGCRSVLSHKHNKERKSSGDG